MTTNLDDLIVANHKENFKADPVETLRVLEEGVRELLQTNPAEIAYDSILLPFILNDLAAFYAGKTLQQWRKEQRRVIEHGLFRKLKRHMRGRGHRAWEAEDDAAAVLGMTAETIHKRDYRARKRRRRIG
jgi:hypothetical protein